MEENVTDNLNSYIASIAVAEEASLFAIRQWRNLSVAFDGDTIWIKGFSREQAFSSYLKQIPFIDLYEQREGLLFKKGKLVPERKMPRGLLWNPVQHAFPVSVGEVNHTFSGINQKVPVRIVPAATEQFATALLTEMDVAEDYITRSAAVRLQPLRWCIVGTKAFFVGTPLLSIPGTAYWLHNGNFIPAGYDFEFPALGKSIYQRLDPERDSNVIWFTDSRYVLLPVKNLVPLSVSSFRLSKQ